MRSKERKRTASLATEPMISEVQPLYNAAMPSLRNTWLTTRKGFLGVGAVVVVFSARNWTRLVCVQVRRHPIRDGLGAVLGGVLTCYFWCLKFVSDLTVLTGNFQIDSIVALPGGCLECCLECY